MIITMSRRLARQKETSLPLPASLDALCGQRERPFRIDSDPSG